MLLGRLPNGGVALFLQFPDHRPKLRIRFKHLPMMAQECLLSDPSRHGIVSLFEDSSPKKPGGADDCNHGQPQANRPEPVGSSSDWSHGSGYHNSPPEGITPIRPH